MKHVDSVVSADCSDADVINDCNTHKLLCCFRAHFINQSSHHATLAVWNSLAKASTQKIVINSVMP